MEFDYLKHMTDGLDRNAALDELMLAYGKDVWNYAFFLTCRREAAEDIAQDVFVKAYQSLHTYRGEAPIKPWLLSITRNAALDYLRSSWVRKVRFLAHEVRRTSHHPSAENEWLRREEHRAIWDVVLGLPRKLREALLLFAHHQLSIREISALLEVSEGTVKSRLFRARESVNRTLRSSGQERSELS
ncbi:sigma-70 family RNA polymerase sigma factor [Cohnella fermenti]|uniref:RNA polymerase sigma factor n=1 Tax=Cohnella fermenti TaxID=2565925 RepID=A0A4S4C9P4_9BACL|nr:sigma-70 family RNA polymerase sigma factor [Cohnella fermenti]THF84086.1 sigma-70 family RNA polymerase sigma factor [Cohnella fermenti]